MFLGGAGRDVWDNIAVQSYGIRLVYVPKWPVVDRSLVAGNPKATNKIVILSFSSTSPFHFFPSFVYPFLEIQNKALISYSSTSGFSEL